MTVCHARIGVNGLQNTNFLSIFFQVLNLLVNFGSVIISGKMGGGRNENWDLRYFGDRDGWNSQNELVNYNGFKFKKSNI